MFRPVTGTWGIEGPAGVPTLRRAFVYLAQVNPDLTNRSPGERLPGMRAIGQVSTSATTQVPIEGTAYVEQTAGAQRSLKSSNAADAAAGTGARTVRVTYFTLDANGQIAGPYMETVILNGVTPVPMVALNVALIEKMEVLTVGAGGVPAGIISLCAANDGTGTVIGTIAAGLLATQWAHHYVPTGYQTRITDLETLGGAATAATVDVAAARYPNVAVEQTVTGPYGTTATLPRGVNFTDSPHAPIPGPARVRMRVTPGTGAAQVTTGSFGYVDQRVAAF